MQDRISTKPGRVLITPEDGSAPFYATMTMADEPTDAGTPLNKATLLSDETAQRLALPQNPTVDKALNALIDKGIPEGGYPGNVLKLDPSKKPVWQLINEVPNAGTWDEKEHKVLTATKEYGIEWMPSQDCVRISTAGVSRNPRAETWYTLTELNDYDCATLFEYLDRGCHGTAPCVRLLNFPIRDRRSSLYLVSTQEGYYSDTSSSNFDTLIFASLTFETDPTFSKHSPGSIVYFELTRNDTTTPDEYTYEGRVSYAMI